MFNWLLIISHRHHSRELIDSLKIFTRRRLHWAIVKKAENWIKKQHQATDLSITPFFSLSQALNLKNIFEGWVLLTFDNDRRNALYLFLFRITNSRWRVKRLKIFHILKKNYYSSNNLLKKINEMRCNMEKKANEKKQRSVFEPR